MRGTYQDEERQAVAPVFNDEEQERQAGLLGLLVVAGLLVAVGVFWGWWTLGVILAILVMIVLHELGHYLTAKWAGMKVTEFFVAGTGISPSQRFLTTGTGRIGSTWPSTSTEGLSESQRSDCCWESNATSTG